MRVCVCVCAKFSFSFEKQFQIQAVETVVIIISAMIIIANPYQPKTGRSPFQPTHTRRYYRHRMPQQ